MHTYYVLIYSILKDIRNLKSVAGTNISSDIRHASVADIVSLLRCRNLKYYELKMVEDKVDFFMFQ